VISQRTVALAAGVSSATVSNVLNNPDLVADQTRERVLRTIADLGYVRNEAARHLKAGRSRAVGFVAYDIANPYFAEMLAPFEDEITKAGLHPLLMNSGQSESRELANINLLQQLRVEGVVIAPLKAMSLEVANLRRTGTSVVVVDRIEPETNFCSVACDDVAGGGLQARHLLETGHRHIAFVGGPLTRTQVHGRLVGMQSELVGERVVFEVIETQALKASMGSEVARALADRPVAKRPTALACANDQVALGVLQGFVSKGIRVPQDVAIIGYDDIEYARAAAIPLSSVRQPVREIGEVAVRMLLEEIDAHATGAPHEHRSNLVTPELVVRSSTIRD